MKFPFPKPKNSAGGNGTARHSTSIDAEKSQNLIPSTKRNMRRPRQNSKQTATKRMLRYLSEYDPLTSLPNRNLFQRHLQKTTQIARRDNSHFALLVMGLDRFREINHALGSQSGDSLLREVARRFENVTDRCLIRARIGDDEFAAAFAGATKRNIETVCASVLKMLASPFVIQDLPIDLSASIGVALWPEHGKDANLILQRANIALDLAKQSGSGYAVYEPATDPYGQRKLAYLGSLRHAIEQEQLVLHYQPEIDLRTRRARGVEALVRWHHPQIGLIPPYYFISLAEQTGLIHALTRWVLKAALDRCYAWRQAGLQVPVAVNLSPRDFHDRQLPKHITGLLKERGLPPECLELEITENVIMANAVHVSQSLNRLSAMGIRAYIDDFGTGYSSLGLLKKLPVAGIKIDKSFVSHMTVDENDAIIVRSTIDLGHNLGMKVIAEGVESPDIWNRLAKLGCDVAQGYYMSRPKPAEELDRWFADSPWGIKDSRNKVKKKD
jgi:diguanylate cyclase (GGDEF)-like protein